MRKSLLGAAVCLAVPFLSASCGLMPVEEELPAAPLIRSYEAAEYEQTTVKRGDMELTKTVKCTYASARQEKYSFSLGGMYIDKVYVSEGQQVREGALLAELEQGDLPERISDGEYALNVLRVSLSNLGDSQRLELEKQAVVIAGMEEQIAYLMALSESYDEGRDKAALIDQANGILIQKLELEKQKTALEEAYERQRQKLEDSLYIAGLRLEELKEGLLERRIYAGFDGTIIYLRETKEGERSVKGRDLITLADLGTVAFTVKGEDAQYFPIGAQVTVRCEQKDFSAQAVDASVFGLGGQGEGEDSVAYLQLLQPDPALENGAGGSIRITLEQREDVLYVNKDAIKTADGGQFVYMLDGNGLRIRQKVITGLESGDYVEIVSGLVEGDSVIIK